MAVLDVGRLSLELQRPAVRINQRVPLTALDLLAAIVAPDASAFGRLDALAIHHGRNRAGFPACPLAGRA
jgi:hypothetical protein